MRTNGFEEKEGDDDGIDFLNGEDQIVEFTLSNL